MSRLLTVGKVHPIANEIFVEMGEYVGDKYELEGDRPLYLDSKGRVWALITEDADELPKQRNK